MNFKSDNIIGVHPKIMQALLDVNEGVQSSYGADTYSMQLTQIFSDVFEKEISVYLTSTGTAANSLALSALACPFDAIYCHKDAHIHTDEANGPEFFTGGAKLITIDGENGKIDVNLLQEAIDTNLSLRPHSAKPGCISLTQTTECGTVYSLQELENIKKIAQKYKLPIHMDGARFAGSLAYLKCTPAELTWKSGVDVMSFGATKNGALAAEAIVFFNPKHAQDFDYRQKRAGQLMSKMRFFACQFFAYFKDDLWLHNARHANDMAQKLANLFISFGFKLQYPVQSNEVFVRLSEKTAKGLEDNGAGFYEWSNPGSNLYRFVTSCFTCDADLETLKTHLSELS